MPVKWKIFFALNLILALPAVSCLLLLLIRFDDVSGDSESWIFALFFFSLAMMTLNAFLNIYMIQRFYPDRSITQGVRKMNGISLVITSIVAVGLLIICIYGASIEFTQREPRASNSGKIALAIFAVALIFQIIVLVLQTQLPHIIGHNSRQKMQTLIDSIGNSA